MNRINKKLKFYIDEPLELSKNIDVKIISTHQTNEGKSCFLIEDETTKENYVISGRYKDYKLADIYLGKIIVVAVARPKIKNFSFDNPDFESDLSYIGIGHIEISE